MKLFIVRLTEFPDPPREFEILAINQLEAIRPVLEHVRCTGTSIEIQVYNSNRGIQLPDKVYAVLVREIKVYAALVRETK